MGTIAQSTNGRQRIQATHAAIFALKASLKYLHAAGAVKYNDELEAIALILVDVTRKARKEGGA